MSREGFKGNETILYNIIVDTYDHASIRIHGLQKTGSEL